MKIEPFGERVAVKVIPVEEKTDGGLIVATSKSSSNRGEIVALSQAEEVRKDFKIGDKVLFVQNSGVNYTDGSEDYKILSTKDVLCKVIED